MTQREREALQRLVDTVASHTKTPTLATDADDSDDNSGTVSSRGRPANAPERSGDS